MALRRPAGRARPSAFTHQPVRGQERRAAPDFAACNPDRWGDNAWGKGSGNSQARGFVAGASFDSFPGSSAAESCSTARAALAAARLKGASMAGQYDLLHEEWIPCVYPDGLKHRGLLGAVRDAGRIREIAGSSPLDTFSLYRFLLAVVHWAMPLHGEEQWRKAWSRPKERFLADLVAAVSKRCAGQFDLLGEARFLQRAGPRETRGRPVSDLYAELPGRTEIRHFKHVGDESVALCLACCARGLIRLPAFCQSRLAGSGVTAPASINGWPPVYFLPVGATLVETLLLNLPEDVAPGDQPAWEGEPTRGPIGVLEGFTWQARRTGLGAPICDATAYCQQCGAEGGETTPLFRQTAFGIGRRRSDFPDRNWNDPHVAYVRRGSKGASSGQAAERKELRCPNPVRTPDQAAAVWRRIAKAIVDSIGVASEDAPIRAVRRACCRLAGHEALRVLCFVPHTREAKTFDHREDSWEFPPAVISDREVAGKLSAQLDDMEGFLRRLRSGWRRAKKPNARKRGGGEVVAYLSRATPAFEADARERFRELLWDLGSGADVASAVESWRRDLGGMMQRAHGTPGAAAAHGALQQAADEALLRVAVSRAMGREGQKK